MDATTYASHSAISDPGRHAAALRALACDTPALHLTVTNLILHYRADVVAPTADQLPDIDARWIDAVLDTALERGDDLTTAREPAQRVAGCCRDHSLLAVSILREHGIPARTRIGFAGYFTPGFHHDHVVVERWGGKRWQRFDPELAPGSRAFDVTDMPTGLGSPFESAAEVWLAHRRGQIDASRYGVAPELPQFSGAAFVQGYVVFELAHRRREEYLLWDGWEAMAPLGDAPDAETTALTDRIAESLVRADTGDEAAERELDRLWEAARPRESVTTYSPSGRIGDTDMATRATVWRTEAG